MKKNKLIPASEYCKSVFDGTHDTPKPCTEGHKLLTSKNILNGELDKSNAYYISEEDYNAINIRSKVHQDDILFSMIGSVGNVCLIKDNDSAIDFAIKNMGVFSCGEKEKAVFLYYYLQSPFAKKTIESYLNGAVQKFLGLECLRTFPVPEYSDDMKKIAAVLSALDDKIALNRRMNAKLEQMAKRLYDYWFVQFDFPNADGKPYKSTGGKMVWNEELKREIPEGWEVTPLKECINHINTGLNPRDNFVLGNGNIKYITVKNLTESGMIDFSNCDLIDEEARSMVHNRSDIKIGDILFASICPLGRCYLINEEPKDWDINESVFTIRSNYKNMSSQFLYNILRDEYYVRKMTQKATGSIFKGIRVDDLGKMEIVLPSKEIIDSFTAKITPLLNQQAKLQQESMKLSEMRDKLLPLLMNGQVEVK